MKTVILIVAMLATSIGLAADPICPTPKAPTCKERIARAKTHGCIIQPVPEVITVTKEVPGPERVVVKEVRVEVPGPERTVTKTVEVEAPYEEKGRGFIAFGPMLKQRWGATVVGGYISPKGLIVQAGPFWLPSRDVNGTVNPCDGKRGEWCYDVPFHVEAKSPWGVQALVGYVF